jgi:hypothetical protein
VSRLRYAAKQPPGWIYKPRCWGSVEQRLRMRMREDARTGCWIWHGASNQTGYGQLNIKHKRYLAHRLSYETFIGPIGAGLSIDHLCRNRRCINPSHLEAVTLRENILRGTSPSACQARQTHCKHGHEYTTENTYWNRGHRDCRICMHYRTLAKKFL